MPKISPELLVFLTTVIFFAGVGWGALLRLQRDVKSKAERSDLNNIGAMLRRDRWNIMIALMLVTDSRDDRQRLADLLRQQ
jgi:hypothetical protein